MSADDRADDDLETEQLPETIHVADDLDEYLERQRFKQIFKAKKEAADTLRKFGNPAAQANGPQDLQFIRERVSAVIVSYITEIRRPLEETEQGRELWQNTHITTVPIQTTAPIPNGDITRLEPTAGLQPIRYRDNYYYQIDGVEDYLTLHDTEAKLETMKTSSGNWGDSVRTNEHSIDPYPTIPTSRTVYQELTRLLTDIGLDLELGEEDDDEWEI